MSERNKEIVMATVLFLGAIAFGLYAALGKVALGAMSLEDTRVASAICSVWCAVPGIFAAIGDRRSNDWLAPRLRAYFMRREQDLKEYEAWQAELDLKDPSRIARRERREKRLHFVGKLVFLLSPLVLGIVSAISAAYFDSDICRTTTLLSMILAVCVWSEAT